MDIRRLIVITRKWLPLLVASVALAAGVAFLVSSQLPKTYEAKATLVVGQSLSAANPDYTQILVSQRLSSTYATIATKQPILDAVIKDLGLAMTAEELSKHVQASSPVDSTLLNIATQDTDPVRAAAITNAVAKALVSNTTAIGGPQAEIQAFVDSSLTAIQSDIEATQAQAEALRALTDRTTAQDAALAAADARLTSLRSTYATLLAYFSGSASNHLSIVAPATVPTEATSPRVLLLTLVAAAIGLFLAAAFVTVVERLDDGIRDPDMIREVTGLSTLGSIVRMRGEKGRSEIYRLAATLYPRSGTAEAYRTLRTNVEFSSVDKPLKTLLVTSAMPGEGKTVTAANLAVVFAQAGRRVLLVDADLRKPGIHIIFDTANGHGLTTLLRDQTISLDAVAQSTEQESLRILTTGPLPPNPAELTASHRMQTVLDRLAASADLVIFDSPPVRAVADAVILSALVDGTLIVVDAARSRRRSVLQAREALAKANATVLGAVLNRVPVRAGSDDPSYYGDYYASTEAAERSAEGTATSLDLPSTPGRESAG
jgi:tyrosine-protein kinase